MGGKPAKKQDLFDVSMDIKLASRQMANEAKKVERLEVSERKKVATAISKGQLETARVYAENAIRNKREGINLIRLSAKMEALAAKLEGAHRTQSISKTLASSVPLIQSSLVQMDKIGIGSSLEQFEKLFEDLDVKTTDLSNAMDGMYASSLDQGEVDLLINQVAEENNLDVKIGMGATGKQEIGGKPQQASDISDLENKLNMLKNI